MDEKRMILEGIATTLNDDGTVNIAPMGPIVDESMSALLFRPFRTSRTFANLKRTRCGVFHVVDDVLLLAQAAIGSLETEPTHRAAEVVSGRVLDDACRWYEFQIVDLDDSSERTRMQAEVVHTGRLRDFFGFNRAKHAVLEAAILATRVHLIEPTEIQDQMNRLRSPMEKTAGPAEREAFELLAAYISDFSQAPCRNS